MAVKVCFMGGTRYSAPLDATSEKKFEAMSSLAEISVIGFSRDLHFRRFTNHAHFYLLPCLPLPILRHAAVLVFGVIIGCWLVLYQGVQILVAQSPFEGVPAALAKKIAGWFGYKVVLVVESHGDFETSLFMQRRIVLPALYRSLMRNCANFALGQADLLRAVSNSAREQLERWIQGKQIFQFATWTDIEVFLRAGCDEREPSCQDILYGGVLIPRKGVHHLINVFLGIAKEFPRSRLFIVGHEENKTYAAELNEQVARLSLDGRVQFIGQVQQAELARWMRSACMFVLPTYSEGLPRVVFEAMAARLPVIATNVSGIPDVLQDGVTGFTVPPGDELALAESIRWVLGHPDNACEVGRRAHAFAERFFSTGAYVESYRRVIEAANDLVAETREHAPSAL